MDGRELAKLCHMGPSDGASLALAADGTTMSAANSASAPKIGGRKELRAIGRARLKEMGFERVRTGVQQAADLLCEV